MKYLTKEWEQQCESSFIISWIRASKDADQADEKKIERLYIKEQKKFIETERAAVAYVNESNNTRGKIIDTYLACPGLSVKKIGLLEGCKETLVMKKPMRFEEDTAEKWFEIRLRDRIALCKQTLPQDILQEIADLRLFCLGYATQSVKEKVRVYCREQKKKSEIILKETAKKIVEAEDRLDNGLKFGKYIDKPLMNLELQDGDLYIKLEDIPRLIVRDVEFIEREKEFYYRWNKNIYSSPWTYVIQSELHFVNDRYEVHFLLENKDEIGETENWYLTVSGTNVEAEL